MRGLRNRIASLFERWIEFVEAHTYLVLVVTVGMILGLTSQLPRLTVDTSIEGFLEKDNPDMLIYDEFREQFGRDDRIMLGVRSSDGVFNLEFLNKLRRLHETLERELPYLEEVESLINARAVYGTEEELIIEDLFESWPETAQELETIHARALDNPMFKGLWLSDDANFTIISIKIRRYAEEMTDEEMLDDLNFEAPSGASTSTELQLIDENLSGEVVYRLIDLIKDFDSKSFRVHAAGQPVLSLFLSNAMLRDMQLFSALGIVTIAVLLFILFRSFTAVVPPILVVIFSLLSTLSCMAIAGEPIQLPTQVLPSFLLAVGVADAVHVLSIFHQRRRAGSAKLKALREAFGHAGLPILFTSLTTAGGLFSFTSSDMAPVASLGVYAPVGVMFAFFYTLTLLPVLVILLPTWSPRVEDRDSLSGRVLVSMGRFALRRPWLVIVVTILMAGVALDATMRLRFSHNPLTWFPTDYPLRRDTLAIDSAMAGTMTMEVLIDKGEDYAFHDPANLRSLERFTDEVEAITGSVIRAGQSLSIVDVLKEINRGLNGNEMVHYKLADERSLISQELLLFENSGSEDLEQLVDTLYSKARVTLFVNWDDALEYVPFVEHVKAIAADNFEVDEITVTGLLPMLASTFSILIMSMTKSFALALVIIVPLIMLIVGDIKTGSLAMGTNILPILLCLGVMGMLDYPIDAFSMLIGGVSIGLVVDDGIHFLHHFKRHLDEAASVEFAVSETLRTTGRAMLFTTVVLVSGFCTFAISSMDNLVRFGLLTSFTISLALLADILLLPALISLFYSERPSNSPAT